MLASSSRAMNSRDTYARRVRRPILTAICAVLVVASGCGGDQAPRAKPAVSVDAGSNLGCLSVPAALVKKIESGLTNQAHEIEVAQAAKAPGTSDLFFVSARIRRLGIATWAVDKLDPAAQIGAVNTLAQGISNWPPAEATMAVEGAAESQECIETLE